MPARLIYSPKVWAFTKDSKGNMYDISPYIVSGEVVRNINQVSTASLVLRNPKKVFTSPKKGVPFHPQDPITIYMERLAGYPVRVFTGYLDQSPYYQLQPGVIQLQASCTLKRLLYTYFDPSLPYMISFFTKYGWLNTGTGSIISESSLNTTKVGTSGTLQDGNITKLLWAILYDIGEWDNEKIYIEPLPTGTNGIINTIKKLMTSIDESNKIASELFESFLTMTIGAQSEGGTTTAVSQLDGSTNVQKAYNFFLTNGLSGHAAAGIVGNWQQESGVNPAEAGGYLAQWGGSRLTDLENFASSLGKPVTDLKTQLQFCWHEFNSDYASTLSYLREATSASEAATIVCNLYEEPGTADGHTTTISPASQGYPVFIEHRIQNANSLYNQYGNGTTVVASKNSKTGTEKTKKVTLSSSLTSLGTAALKNDITANTPNDTYTAIVQAANAMADSGLPYPKPDAHYGTLSKIWPAYDCSGSVSYVLYSAGLIGAGDAFATGSAPGGENEYDYLLSLGFKAGVGPSGNQSVTIWVDPGVHTFMRIGGKNGRYWGTTDGTVVSKQGAGAWLSQGNATPGNVADSSFLPCYIPQAILTKAHAYHGPLPVGGDSIPASSQGSSDSIASQAADTISKASAEAFAQQLDFPTAEDSVVAILLGSEGKGLMHDQALMPFVQQVAQSCMRSFMSLPDGSFYAFFPDYFGEFGQHNPYWMIDDVEITSGTIYLTDDALSTHVFAVGDQTFWGIGNTSDSTQLMNELFSTGTITVYNAFASQDITDHNKKPGGMSYLMTQAEAVNFVKRFGARPLVQEYPMVRSTIFEMLMAYQLFMTAWSNQFLSTFTFTFMPELFPGGKVGFKNHDLMMYINQVTHTFDYTEGFETTAQLSAPALLPGVKDSKLLPDNMISAMAEPVKKSSAKTSDNKQSTTKPKKSEKKKKAKHTKPSTSVDRIHLGQVL